MSGSQSGRVRTSILVAAVLATVMVAGCESSDEDIEASGEAAATTSPGIVSEPGPTEAGTDARESTARGSTAEETTAEQTTETTADETTAEATEAPEEAAETEPARTEDEAAPFGDVIVVSDFATFTTPAQAAYCIMSGPSDGMAASISCEVAQSSVPPDEELMGVCAAEGIGWFFNFFADTGHGGFFCNHVDGITRGGGNPHYWQDDPWIDPNNVVTLPSGARVAVLDYGRVMRAGDMDCTVQPAGLTCRAAGSGRGFTVNSASYTSW